MTSTAIQAHTPTTSAIDLARMMADSNLLPEQYRKQPANLLFAFEYADSIGVPRVQALTSINVINGKPTASADLIAGLVRRAGHKLRIIESTDASCTVQIVRADDPNADLAPCTWTVEKAKRAGLWGSKGPWTNYPAAMLRSRAITEAARMHASDALFGIIYTPEELGADVDEEGTLIAAPAVVAAPSIPTVSEPTPSVDPVAKARGELKARLAALDPTASTALKGWWATTSLPPATRLDADGIAAVNDHLDDLESDTVDAELVEDDRMWDTEPSGEHSDVMPGSEFYPFFEGEPPTVETGEKATDKQIKKIRAMARQKLPGVAGPDLTTWAATTVGRDLGHLPDITKTEASTIIDLLDEMTTEAAS